MMSSRLWVDSGKRRICNRTKRSLFNNLKPLEIGGLAIRPFWTHSFEHYIGHFLNLLPNIRDN